MTEPKQKPVITIINETSLPHHRALHYLYHLFQNELEAGKEHIFHTYQDFKIKIAISFYPKGIRCEVKEIENE